MPEPKREITLWQLLPNAMTLGSIAAGLTALRLAVSGYYDFAILLVILAAILDGLDGKVARALGHESPLGAELDSLADVVNFGVVPAFILGFWQLLDVPVLGWGAALIFVSCSALRLARFNVGKKNGTGGDARFFTGVPTPAAALLAVTPLALDQATGIMLPGWVSAFWLIGIGVLMMSRLPTFSLKMSMPRAWAKPGMVVFAAVMAAVVIMPWVTLLVINLGYLCSIPLAARTKATTSPPSLP